MKRSILIFILQTWLLSSVLFAQQIAINRIEQMPNQPVPYSMRNWKQVAMGYDSLVFNLDLKGQYLPLIWLDSSTVNYPEHPSFGLYSAVGIPNQTVGEAINVLPAVIGASLVGIDKSNQNGHNWVLYCEEFFNRRPEENVYLNAPMTSSGSDWWYDTMPNVFFYQLYDLYPNTGDFAYQFVTVAERWLEAVERMGGSTTPWTRPYMNYRAWKLATMSPLSTGVPEPEAAGAIGWLLYHAFVETGQEKYRIGAEWCLEFLANRGSNPSYELQLPYGAYTAARMNAELGTNYNMQKLVNWCFDVNPLRGWGATLGNWGGYDCYGLIGEARYEGYAFIMNGFQMAAALVPMVRYDDRFARAIGKWMLNLANASRLFYPNYLPDDKQDSEEWSHQYDPHSYISHEALREKWNNISPFATGDFIINNWGPTNLTLYGASHVGIFGGIIDTTNVPMILRLDTRKTDFFQDKAYATYLYFNPYNEEKTVEIELGWGIYDLYDAVSNRFLKTNVSGIALFQIPGDSAVLLVLAPAGGTITYDLDRMLINGVPVDYRSGRAVANHPPRIKALAAKTQQLIFGQKTTIYCSAEDRDGHSLSYTWQASDGQIVGSGAQVDWTAPNTMGIFVIDCIVDDGNGGRDTASISLEAAEYINHAPVIERLGAQPRKIDLGGSTTIFCQASDPDHDHLSYNWSASFGNLTATDSVATWTAPAIQGFYYIFCTVTDPRGAQARDSTVVIVQDFSNPGTGIPVAYYPFNGNARDLSGLANHGVVYGAKLTEDRFGNPNRAYFFDGVNDYINVKNNSLLNFQEEISVSFWMRVDEFFGNREAYPISHGNWENRWKISIIPEKNIRWTVKTDRGIKDLDSKTIPIKDVFYHVVTLYDGTNFDIYVNGALDNHATHSGQILRTSIDLTIGQVLPNNTSVNFKGVLDDIRIFNYALSPEEIQNLYQEKTAVYQTDPTTLPSEFDLAQNFPNPFNAETTIRYQLKSTGRVTIEIYDLLGQKVRTLVDEEQKAGFYSTRWDGKNDRGILVASGIYIYKMKSTDFFKSRKLVLMK
ncbi:MAG: T9SS type A sorting domain-containing protein [candidate division KSB1 bacterium]|nr:T9SS type A sorting domain-containing protein [candidate division KSB1 bacterium]